jgi:hypothetical protein
MSRVSRTVSVICTVVFVCLGCSGTDDSSRERALDTPTARRLVGSWDATFTLDRPLIVTADSTRPRSVTGALAFVEARRVPPEVPQLSGATHDVAFDVDFLPFGLDLRARGASPVAVARTSERDSVSILFGADESLHAVRVQGAFVGDSVTGVWTADSPRSAGAGGRFSMHRHQVIR